MDGRSSILTRRTDIGILNRAKGKNNSIIARCYVEGGFLSNTVSKGRLTDRQIILTQPNAIAMGIYEGVLEWWEDYRKSKTV